MAHPRLRGRCLLLGPVAFVLLGCGAVPPIVAGAPLAEGVVAVDDGTLRGPRHFVDGYPARPAPGQVNVVVEIPAGTHAKFEVDHESGLLVWERREGSRRVIDFLPYPGNYGLIPSTALPRAAGGDGDPLDVLLLGPVLPRGAVVAARPVAVLRLLDEGEHDDKVLAVPASGEGPMGEVEDLADLEARYPSALRIVERFFASYDGEGTTAVGGWEDAEAAQAAVDAAARAHAGQAGHP